MHALIIRVLMEKKIDQCDHSVRSVECGKKVGKDDCTSDTCGKVLKNIFLFPDLFDPNDTTHLVAALRSSVST